MVFNDLNQFAKKFLNKKLYFIVRKTFFQIRKITHIKYLNGNMYCPCCGKHITGFINFKYKSSHYNPEMYCEHYKNTVCPVCGSLPRQRVFAYYVQNNINVLKDNEILFFAPSYAGELCLKRYGITYKSADLYQFADLLIDIQDIKMCNESVDIIFCNHVLEHVPNYKLALQEMYRILKVGGILELSVPQFPNEVCTPIIVGDSESNWKNYGQKDHLRIFGTDIEELLLEIGFQVTVVRGDECPKNYGCKLGPANYDIDCIYICTKK